MPENIGHFEAACSICRGSHGLGHLRYNNIPFQDGKYPQAPLFDPEIATCNGEPYEVTPAMLIFVPDEPVVPAKLTQDDIDSYKALPPHEKLKVWDSYTRLVQLGELEPFEGFIEKPGDI